MNDDSLYGRWAHGGRGHVAPLVIAVALTVGGCGSDGGEAPDDAGGGTDAADDAGPAVCGSDDACDDGTFCNGAERCDPEAEGAGPDGCLAASESPCVDGQSCDEDTDECLTECDVSGDADGDGHDATSCGGDDCDDSDPNRFPGNPEVCDAEAHDEDCDPSTFGFRDSDGDDVPDAACCNETSAGMAICGSDCDDARPDIKPGATEACDGEDNDCDADIDEGVMTTFYRDADGDNHGVEGMTMQACSPPEGYAALAGDCDDDDPRRHDDRVEQCDGEGVDEDCDGEANPPSLCDCSGSESRSCSEAGLAGPCASGTQDCLGGSWGMCSIAPGTEVCNGVDDNCDGATDEPFECVRDSTVPCTTSCGTDGVELCGADCTYQQCATAAEVCNYCDDNNSGGIADERAIATFTQDLDFDHRDEHGDAGLLLYTGAVHDSTGAYYYGDPVVLGFGELTFEVELTANVVAADDDPRYGWAAIVMHAPSSGFLGSASELGVPRNGALTNRRGYAVEWAFRGSLSDELRVRNLNRAASPTDPVVETDPTISPDLGGSVDAADQGVVIRLRPDIPDTSVNEMRLIVEAPSGGEEHYRCVGGDCDTIFRVGDDVRLGLTGGNGDEDGERSFVAAAGSDLTIEQPQSCAP